MFHAMLLVIAAFQGNEPPGLIKREFIYDQAPFPECHASTIAESKKGLVAAWFGGTHEKHKDVCIWVSRLADGQWTAPQKAADGIVAEGKRYPCWNPVLHQVKNGPLQLFYKVGPGPSNWWGELKTSPDGGETWSWPQRLPEGFAGPIKNKPVTLADGTLICGSSTENNGWRVHFERTSDGGKTWTTTGPINSGKDFDVIQPTLLLHKDGKLQALCRTRGTGKIVETWSEDGGHTWSKLTPTALPNPNSGIDAVTLRDGSFLLVYNHTGNSPGKNGGERSPLNVAVSKDGKIWQAALVLEDKPGAEFSYPAVIQTADGLVHTTYTWERKRIRHVVIDPSQLHPQPFVNGEWPKP